MSRACSSGSLGPCGAKPLRGEGFGALRGYSAPRQWFWRPPGEGGFVFSLQSFAREGTMPAAAPLHRSMYSRAAPCPPDPFLLYLLPLHPDFTCEFQMGVGDQYELRGGQDPSQGCPLSG